MKLFNMLVNYNPELKDKRSRQMLNWSGSRDKIPDNLSGGWVGGAMERGGAN